MKSLIKIFHIDADYKIFNIVIRNEVMIKTEVSMELAICMLKKKHFDLILFEPENLAILTREERNDLQDKFNFFEEFDKPFLN